MISNYRQCYLHILLSELHIITYHTMSKLEIRNSHSLVTIGAALSGNTTIRIFTIRYQELNSELASDELIRRRARVEFPLLTYAYSKKDNQNNIILSRG